MLIKTSDSLKFRNDRSAVRLVASIGAVAFLTIGLAACGGGSDVAPDQGPESSVKKSQAFQAPAIETGQKVPEGLEDETGQALIAVLQAEPDYSSYVKLLQLSGVSEDLATGDSLTVFAPVNEAVQAQSRLLDRYLKPKDLDSVLAALGKGVQPEIADPESLADLMRRGIANGELPPEAVKAGLKLDPLAGDTLRITKSGDDFRVDGIRFDTGAGTLASNGILYPAAGLIAP